MKKKIISFVLVVTMIFGKTITAHAVTPQYKPLSEYGYTGVPEINIKLSDEVKAGVEQSVNEQLKDLNVILLETPKIEKYKYIKQKKKKCLNVLYVKWNCVEDAESYELNITKHNGEAKTYETKYTTFMINGKQYNFIKCDMEKAEIKVRAIGKDRKKLSLWSDEVIIK